MPRPARRVLAQQLATLPTAISQHYTATGNLAAITSVMANTTRPPYAVTVKMGRAIHRWQLEDGEYRMDAATLERVSAAPRKTITVTQDLLDALRHAATHMRGGRATPRNDDEADEMRTADILTELARELIPTYGKSIQEVD